MPVRAAGGPVRAYTEQLLGGGQPSEAGAAAKSARGSREGAGRRPAPGWQLTYNWSPEPCTARARAAGRAPAGPGAMPDLKRASSKRRRSGSRKLSEALSPGHLKDEVDAESFERDWGISPKREVGARLVACPSVPLPQAPRRRETGADGAGAACRRSCWSSSGRCSRRRAC